MKKNKKFIKLTLILTIFFIIISYYVFKQTNIRNYKDDNINIYINEDMFVINKINDNIYEINFKRPNDHFYACNIQIGIKNKTYNTEEITKELNNYKKFLSKEYLVSKKETLKNNELSYSFIKKEENKIKNYDIKTKILKNDKKSCFIVFIYDFDLNKKENEIILKEFNKIYNSIIIK